MWDFSICWSINVVLILMYVVQLVRLEHSDCRKSNRLTGHIYRLFLAGLMNTLVRNTISLFRSDDDLTKSQVIEYSLQESHCVLFLTASMVYTLEWSALGGMIRH